MLFVRAMFTHKLVPRLWLGTHFLEAPASRVRTNTDTRGDQEFRKRRHVDAVARHLHTLTKPLRQDQEVGERHAAIGGEIAIGENRVDLFAKVSREREEVGEIHNAV